MTLLATWALSAPTVEVAGETTVHVGTNITLKADVEHPLDGVSYAYQWYRDGEPIDGQRGRTLTVTEPGSYAVEVVASNGGDVADAVRSEAVTCTFEAHAPSEGWTTSATSHWHECAVCGANLDEAEHEAEAGWSSDEVQHWHACATCGARIDAEAHDWGAWNVTKKATALEGGSRERTCATCGLRQVEEILPGGVEVCRMLRFYNPWTGEHLYTSSDDEAAALVSQGWRAEGLGWLAPSASGTPVYRLYNSYVTGGDHHYTTSADERDALVDAGWRYEGVGWYSAEGEGAVELLRLYNPYAVTGTHHYTTSAEERDALVEAGWRFEGTAWRGLAE